MKYKIKKEKHFITFNDEIIEGDEIKIKKYKVKMNYKLMYKPDNGKRFKTWISFKTKKQALKYKKNNFKLFRIALLSEEEAVRNL